MTSEPGRFRQRFPWLGGDLQTVRNYIVRPKPWQGVGQSDRLEIPLNDGTGDRLVTALDWPSGTGSSKPLVLLIHGLTGCQDSFYILNSMRHWLGRGHPVLRLNLRAAGPSRPLCSEQYHAGRSRDLAAALAALSGDFVRNGVIAIGYSLGGNVLLKYLGEEGASAPVRFAASISAPIDLSATAARFLRARNVLYQRWLLSGMKAEATAPGAAIDEREREAIMTAHSVWQFDDAYIAPRNGFAGAEDYYAQCSAARFLGGIRIPTLLIHARDDPWIPSTSYEAARGQGSSHVAIRLTVRGGHVGFHGRGSLVAWHDRIIAAELDAVAPMGS